MTGTIVLIAGSPAPDSRSSSLLEAFGAELVRRGFELQRFSLDSFPLEGLLRGRTETDSVARFLKAVEGARGVVFSSPTYKATYAGALKLIIDTLPPAALDGKVALAITTARLEPHLVEIDDSFARLYRFFRGSIGVRSLGLLDTQLGDPRRIELDDAGKRAFAEAVDRFTRAAS